jgi:D-arabinose 1-dehydrogenase-like Zn-dependent alcohol dehydrogenase
MYSSIKKTKARPGDWIVILGAGGGLGHMYDLETEYRLVFGTDIIY